MKNIAEIPFVFIVGRPRSGTTLLRTLFDAHPNVIIPPECQFIVNLYPRYGKKKLWKEQDILDFHNDLIDQWLFDTWNIDEDKLKAALLDYVGETTYSTICKVVYMQYVSLFEKEEVLLLGDKNPGYAIYTRLLQKIFPDARFIHILRDYRDNFVSIRNVDFELPVPTLVVQKWKYFYKKFEKDSRSAPEKYRTLRYEALVRNYENEMIKICEFAGIRFTYDIFDFYKKKDVILNTYPPGYIHSYHESLLNRINSKKVGVYKWELTPHQIKLMDVTVGFTAEMAGYLREYRGKSYWLLFLAFPGRFMAGMLTAATWVVDRFPYKTRMAILNKGPLFMARVFLAVFKPKKYREMKDVIVKKK